MEEKRVIPGVSEEIIKLIEDRFEGVTVVEEIGYGSQGTVYKCLKQIEGKDGYPVAVKVIPFYAQTHAQYLIERGRRLQEVETMARLKSEPHIINIIDHRVVDRDEYFGQILILMDYYETSLDKVLDENKPDQYAKVQTGEAVDAAMRVAEELLEALEACAHVNTIHYDIKPENIMIHGKHYFLADFGIAKNRNLSVTNQGSGALRYQPPEGPYLESTGDLYSLGLVLYQMVNKGRLPFEPDYPNENSDNAQKAAAIQRSEATVSYPAPGNSLKPFSDFVLKLCAPKKGDRFQTATEALAALKKIDLNAKEEPKIERVTGDVIDNPRSSNTGRTNSRAQGPATSQPFGNTASGNPSHSSSAPQNGSGQRTNYNFDPMTGRPMNQNGASQHGASAQQTAQATGSGAAGFFADDANRTYSNRNRYKADEVKEVVKEEGKKKRKKKMSKLAKILMIIGIIVGGYIVIQIAYSGILSIIGSINKAKRISNLPSTTPIAEVNKEEEEEGETKEATATKAAETTTAEPKETEPIIRNDTFDDVVILKEGAMFEEEANVKDVHGNTYLKAYSLGALIYPLSIDVSDYSEFATRLCPAIENQSTEMLQLCFYRDYDEEPAQTILLNSASDPIDVSIDLNGAATLNIYLSERDPFNGKTSYQRILMVEPTFTYDSASDQTKITNPFAISKIPVLKDGYGGLCSHASDIDFNRYQTAYELYGMNNGNDTVFDVSSLSRFSGTLIPELTEYGKDDVTVLVYFDDHNTPDWQQVVGFSHYPVNFDFDVSDIKKVRIAVCGEYASTQCRILIVHPKFE